MTQGSGGYMTRGSGGYIFYANIEPSRFFFDGPGSQGKSGDWQLSNNQDLSGDTL